MMRSLFSGVSGLGVHQTKMDVIANNISNVNTIGYKAASVTFSDIYSQKLSGATMPNDATGRGGTNPMQIGLGSTVSAITNLMTAGASQRTNNPSDLMIEGDGFFVVNDVSGNYYTRAGAFTADKDGSLIANGMKLCGWTAADDADHPGQRKIVQGKVEPLNIYAGDNAYSKPAATTSISMEGNLNSTKMPVQKNTLRVYDSEGNSFVFNTTMTYDPTPGNQNWKFAIDPKATVNNDPTKIVDFGTFDSAFTLPFKDGLPTGDPATLNKTITLPVPAANPYTSTFKPVKIDFSQLTQFNSTADASAVTNDGNTAGTMTGYSVGTDGKITGSYTNGDTKLLGQIPIAIFKNAAGLEKMGNSMYATTANSGDFDGVGVDVQATGGNMRSGVLEMSNVDLASEFVTMITTQRGFQANSKVISTSDDMLQEIVNLKR